MPAEFEEVKPDDERLRMYGTFVKIKRNGHNRQNSDYNVLSENDLDEIADLIEIVGE